VALRTLLGSQYHRGYVACSGVSGVHYWSEVPYACCSVGGDPASGGATERERRRAAILSVACLGHPSTFPALGRCKGRSHRHEVEKPVWLSLCHMNMGTCVHVRRLSVFFSVAVYADELKLYIAVYDNAPPQHSAIP
jgi:hypothetical protein